MLYKTVHGSRLYGTAHENSDHDFYVVIAPTGKRKYAKQSIVNGIDTTTVDLPTFIRHATMGVPQALEAMWSPCAIVDEIPWRWNFYAGTEARSRFARTIKNFIIGDAATVKSKRHALRLGIELRDLLKYGRFSPVMRPLDVVWATHCAETMSDDAILDLAFDLAYN